MQSITNAQQNLTKLKSKGKSVNNANNYES